MKVFLLISAVLLANKAYSASTGTLIISGTVAPITNIVVNPTADASNLNITNGETSKIVASVVETCNVLASYRIRMRSTNNSKLKHTTDPTNNTTYTISYDNGPYIALSTTDQDVKISGGLYSLTTNTSSVRVNVAAYETAPAGVYSDTITISIVSP